MRSGNLQSAAGRVQEALEELQIAWQQTRLDWLDTQADAFEESCIRPIVEEVMLAFPAIGQMSQLINAAGRECDE